MPIAIVFGTHLRHHRKARRLTQAELAARVDLSAEMISKVERGLVAPSFATIEKLAQVLGVPAALFFGAGPALPGDTERSRILARIQTKLSRLNEDQLARADTMLLALFETRGTR